MKILHISNDLYPRVTGGTEIFLRQLIDAQRVNPQVEDIQWVAHQSNKVSIDHDFNAETSHNQKLLPPVINSNLRIANITRDADSVPGYKNILYKFKPDIVHLHSFSERCGISHAKIAKEFGAKVVITFHTPGFSCFKGSLIDDSDNVCNGKLILRKCTRCRLSQYGLPRLLSRIISLQNGWPLNIYSTSKLSNILTWRQLTSKFHQSWIEFHSHADLIHVLNEWSQEMLINQGINRSKIHLIRTAGPKQIIKRERVPMEDGWLKLVYWGRCNDVKGLDIIIDSILELPKDIHIRLDFYGPYWDDQYGNLLKRKIEGDKRFNLKGMIDNKKLLKKLQEYDLAVIPSVWLETGPLTVMEAFAAGIPVAGSNLGGIKELIENVPGCKLLDTNSDAWKEYLVELVNKPEMIDFTMPRPRTFDDIGNELIRLFDNNLSNY